MRTETPMNRKRVTADEYQVMVGKYVRMPVPDANWGWHLVAAVRDLQDEMGIIRVPVHLQKRTVYPWKDLHG